MSGSPAEVYLSAPLTETSSAHADTACLPARVTIVIPTFNERENIARLVEQLDVELAGIAWEAIFVDDGSPDGTADEVREFGRHDPRIRCILRLGRRGLAGACVEGMLATSACYVAVMDADLQHDAGLLPRMLATLESDSADLVIGSRYTSGGSADALTSERRFASSVSNTLARSMTGLEVADPMSGFFMVRQDAFLNLAPRLSPEGFKILFDLLATARGDLRVLELPFIFGVRAAGASKLDIRNILDFLGLIVRKASFGVLPLRFVGFVLTGSIGVLVHLAAIRTGLLLGASFLPAQIAATVIAMTSNFVLNNAITYRDLRLKGVAAFKGLLVFYAICGTGALSNIGVAAWLHASEPVWWLAALAGSLVGAVWNYVMASRILWRL